MPRYFGDLSESDMDKLYRIYKADFELFGYEYDRSEFVRSMPKKRSPKSNSEGWEKMSGKRDKIHGERSDVENEEQ